MVAGHVESSKGRVCTRSATAAKTAVGGKQDTLTFDRGIILVDEVALDQLDGQTRFTNTTTTDNNELVLSQELDKDGWSALQILSDSCGSGCHVPWPL